MLIPVSAELVSVPGRWLTVSSVQVKAVGISREDDQMRIAVDKASTPFQIKQRELNVELRALKESAKQVHTNKGEKSIEGAKAASEGRKQYKVTKKRVEGHFVELEKLFEVEKQKQVGAPTPQLFVLAAL